MRVDNQHDLEIALSQPMDLLEKTISQRMVRSMKREGVRMLCVDFDLTLVSVHTKSKWNASDPEGLTPHVRGAIRALMLDWLASGGTVAIVTFSAQQELIEKLVKRIMPKKYLPAIVVVSNDASFRSEVETNAAKIAKFLSERTHLPEHNIQSFSGLGKLRHIWVGMQRLSSRPLNCAPPTSPNHCVLIDDCRENTSICNMYTAVKAFQLLVENKNALFDDMKQYYISMPQTAANNRNDSGVLSPAPLERAQTFPAGC